MTHPDLENLIETARAATPKWCAREKSPGSFMREYEIVQAGGGTLFRSTSYGNMEFDAAHIAAFHPQVAIQLVTEIIALRKAVGVIKRVAEYGPDHKGHSDNACWFCDMGGAGYSTQGDGFHDDRPDKCVTLAAQLVLAQLDDLLVPKTLEDGK